MEMRYDVNVLEKNTRKSTSYLIEIHCNERMPEEKAEGKKIDNDPNLCYQIALTEYEHCIKRSDRLDNKIYILLTVCAFIFVMLTNAISKLSSLRWTKGGGETLVLRSYIALTIIAIIIVGFLLKGLISSLSSIEMKRFDSAEVMERDMTRADKSQVSKYVIALYEEARNHNNALIDKRYVTVNRCVILLIASVAVLLLTSLFGAALPETGAKDEGFFEHIFAEKSMDGNFADEEQGDSTTDYQWEIGSGETNIDMEE